MNDFDIETIKKDLKYQLEFEEIDWDYFIETAIRASEADDKFKEAFDK